MTININAIKDSVDLAQVIGQRVDLTKKGNYWQGLCPFHAESTPSFQVVPSKRFYYCQGCGAKGDVFDFLREIDGLSLPEAAEALGGPLPPDKRPPLPPPPPEWVSGKPPADQPEPPRGFALREFGDPVIRWAYRDANGEVIGWVCRYEWGEGEQRKKAPMAWTWGTDGTRPEGWALKGWTRPRPLFGLDRLAERPTAQVVIGEGEKTVTAMIELLPSQVAVGWPGGAQGIRHADWSAMAGRRVVLVPDADEPGRAAMRWLADHLFGLGCTVKMADPDDDKPSGWDLADALADGWTQPEAIAWVRGRSVDWPVAPAQTASPAPAPATPETTSAEVDVAQEQHEDGGDDKQVLAMRRMSEIGLAERFVETMGKRWRYVRAYGAWYEWVGDRWMRDELGRISLEVMAFLRVTERTKGSGASFLTPSARRSLCSAKTVESVIKLAQAQPQCATLHSLLDAEPHLLGVPGGAIDLQTGVMMPPDQRRLVTRQTNCAPAAGRPERWLAFLHQVMMGRQDQIDFLQRFAGYALLGKLYEPGLAFLHGGGGNGKSVVLEVLRGVMGGYAVSADFSVFAEQRGSERHSTELASLAGARLIVAEEGNESQRLNDARIQKMTGGGMMRARYMHKDEFEFELVGKIMIATNHKPALATVGESMRRRVNMVPFDFTVPEAERDMRLGDRLREEYPQILQWMIEGCLAWRAQGLSAPDSIKAASRGYIASQDAISEFLADNYKIGGNGFELEAAVFRKYLEWCSQGRERERDTLPMRALRDKLTSKPGINLKISPMGRVYEGLTAKL